MTETYLFFVTASYILWGCACVGLALFYQSRYKQSVKRLSELMKKSGSALE